MNQFEITTAIAMNWGKYELGESAKVLLSTISTHYPNIKLFDTTLIKETGLKESTFYRAKKELLEKSLILTEKKSITLNLTDKIFHFDRKRDEKVVNLTDPYINKYINKNKYNNQEKIETKSASWEKKSKDQLYDIG